MPREGKFLSRDEVEELEVYKERGLAPPDKYDNVVYDATQIQGQGYRWKTDEEKSAEKSVADEAKATAERRAKIGAAIDKKNAVGANEQTAHSQVPSAGGTEAVVPGARGNART